MIELWMNGTRAKSKVTEDITAGTVGLQVVCHFDASWDGMHPRLIAKCAEAERAAAIDGNGVAVIPWECLIGGEKLLLGCDGWNTDGTRRTPSRWADCGYVHPGCGEADAQEPEPSPEMGQQIYNMAKKASDDVAELRKDYEQWQEEGGGQGGGGGGTAVDKTLTVPGAAADAKAVGDKVNALKDDLAKLDIIKDSDAIEPDFDIADSDGNIIMRLQDGHIRTKHFDSKATEPVVEYRADAVYVRGRENTVTVQHHFAAGDRVCFHVVDSQQFYDYGRYAAYYEDNKQVIANRRGSNGYVEHVITADCDTVSVKIGGTEYTDGTPIALCVYHIRGVVEPKIVTVAKDNRGAYRTIREAIDSITDANPVSNPHVIYVYPGVYNTLEGYTDAEIATAEVEGGSYTQTSFVGPKLTNGVSIKGVGGMRDEIVLTAELADTWKSAVRNNISTLNIQGSGNIENMTIIGKNIRYCVHDDFRTPVNNNDKRIIRNVKFGGEYLAYAPAFTTYGAGMSSPKDMLLEDCDFGYALGIHTNAGFSYGCTIHVRNCVGHGFKLGDYATSNDDAVNRVIIDNCNFSLLRINHKDTSLKSHVAIDGAGNENMMIRGMASDVYSLGMVEKTAKGIAAGTLVARVAGGDTIAATNKPAIAWGVCIGEDDDYSYIQRFGYITADHVGLSGLSMGDYITVNSSKKLAAGGTAANAIGIVCYVDESSNAYIKMLI